MVVQVKEVILLHQINHLKVHNIVKISNSYVILIESSDDEEGELSLEQGGGGGTIQQEETTSSLEVNEQYHTSNEGIRTVYYKTHFIYVVHLFTAVSS